MSAATKMNRESIPEGPAEPLGYGEEVKDLLFHGMERFADVQKQWMDIALQHNAELVDLLKKTAEKMPGAPRMPMLDVMNDLLKTYASTHKSVMDFMLEQSRVWTDTFTDRTATIIKSTETTTNVAKQTIERSVAVQKKILENSTAQAKVMVEAARRQFGFTGAQADALSHTFQRGVETMVEAQKELLEFVTH